MALVDGWPQNSKTVTESLPCGASRSSRLRQQVAENMTKRPVANEERLFRWRQNSFELLEFRGFLRP